MGRLSLNRLTLLDEPPPASAAVAPPSSVGGQLQAHRARSGLSVDELCEALRIRKAYVEALESGRFADLPGRIYGIGFVRAYAQYVGLDAEEFVRRFRDEFDRDLKPVRLEFPEPPAEARFPTAAVVGVAFALAVLGYGAWFYTSSAGGDRNETIAAVPDELIEVIPETAPALPAAIAVVETAAPPGVEDATIEVAAVEVAAGEPPLAEYDTARPVVGNATAAQAAPVEVLIASRAAVPAAEPVGSPATEPSVLPSGPLALAPVSIPAPPERPTEQFAGDGRVFGETNGDTRVVLQVTEQCWIQVVDASGRAVFTRVLEPGETYRVPSEPGMTLQTGNAGGLVAIVDGASIGPFGESGQVRRNISLDAAALLGGAR